MVLAELGSRISKALNSMTQSTLLDEKVIKDMLNQISAALLQADVDIKLLAPLHQAVKNIDIEELHGANKRKVIERTVLSELQQLLDPGVKPYVPPKSKQNVIMFVGLQGSGKTTTVTKYAHFYQRKGYKTALVCADTFRAGAFDQLKQNATRARIEFYGSYSETDPVQLAADGVRHMKSLGCEVICVDTSGRHKQEAALFEEMSQVQEAVQPDDVVFVIDSNMGQQASAQAEAFKSTVKVGSIIATKMDGHGKGGGALSAVAATGCPICFIGTGEHVEDLEQFDATSFLNKLLGFGDLGGLLGKMKDVGMEGQMEIAGRMMEGQFLLRDLYTQFSNILKMGPLDQVMSMMPGIGAEMASKYKGKEANQRIKGFLVIMDSMTNEELDTNVLLGNNSRISRVARGSGRSVREVSELLKEYKMFQSTVKNMSKVGMSNARGVNMPQQLARAMDPRVLKQMGGAGGMQSMMKNLASSMGGGENPFKGFM